LILNGLFLDISLILFVKKLRLNYKHWDSAYPRQGMSYPCRDISPAVCRGPVT